MLRTPSLNGRIIISLLVFTIIFYMIKMRSLPFHGNYIYPRNQSILSLQSTYPASQELKDYITESELNYLTFRTKRNHVIEKAGGIAKLNPWGQPTFWDYFAPTMACPFIISRLGNLGDGGKYVCGLEEISKKSVISQCIVYSFGVGGDASFEKEILERTNCSVFAFDPTIDGLQFGKDYLGRAQFYHLGLSSTILKSSFPSKSLLDIMKMLGHEWIDLIKMDIERSEVEAMEQIISDFPQGLPFAHLNLELHLYEHENKSGDQLKSAESEEFQNYYKWWNKLENTGLRAYMNEANYLFNVYSNLSKSLGMEYSFLNVKPFMS